MKKHSLFLLACILLSLSAFNLHGQCVPDTVNCKDIDEPGQICPNVLPQAIVDTYYDEVITILSPSTVSREGLSGTVDYLLLDSVANLPEGLAYAVSSDKLYGGKSYCVSITGTPIEAGTDTLFIYVTPFVLIGSVSIPLPQQVDSSLSMTVMETSGTDPGQWSAFRLMPNKPNPFSERTSIAFYTPFDEKIELSVHNILGQRMHYEFMDVSPGKHVFDFNGRELEAGTYIYRVNNHAGSWSGKLVKIKR